MYGMENQNNEPEEIQVDAPLSALPDLGAFGIEEVDKGVCLDTSENRSILRSNNLHYQPVFTLDGKDTPLLQVVTPEMRVATLMASKAAILRDERDSDSDYLTGTALLLEPASSEIVPGWVLAATRKWIDITKKRRETGKNVQPHLAGPPARCRATKIDGHRCQSWQNGMTDYNGYCRTHLSRQSAKDWTGEAIKARNRLLSASVGMADVLEHLAYFADSEPTRLAAANSILDRSGVRAGVDLEVNGKIEHVSGAEIVRERLKEIKEQALKAQAFQAGDPDDTEEAIEAEIVEDDD